MAQPHLSVTPAKVVFNDIRNGEVYVVAVEVKVCASTFEGIHHQLQQGYWPLYDISPYRVCHNLDCCIASQNLITSKSQSVRIKGPTTRWFKVAGINQTARIAPGMSLKFEVRNQSHTSVQICHAILTLSFVTYLPACKLAVTQAAAITVLCFSLG
jgi:hypothetical protein